MVVLLFPDSLKNSLWQSNIANIVDLYGGEKEEIPNEESEELNKRIAEEKLVTSGRRIV